MDRHSGIDALRGLSILGVLSVHSHLFQPVSDFGVYFVDLFFVISGYCMVQSVSVCASAFQFISKRFRRLFPAFFFCALLTAGIELAFSQYTDHGQTWRESFVCLVCFPFFDLPCMILNKTLYPMIDGAYWTLRVESKYYVLLAMLYFFLPKRYYLQSFIVVTAVGGILMAVTNIDPPRPFMPMYLSDFIPYLPFFLAGMGIYEHRSGNRIGLVAVASAVAIETLFMVFGVSGYSLPTSVYMYAALLASVVLVYVFSKRRGWKWLSFIGLISYPLYLIHQDIGLVFFNLTNWSVWWKVLIIAVLIGLAYLVHMYVENLLHKKTFRGFYVSLISRSRLKASG